ncbi:MAG TPA: class I SAM-dependent methyltransferase [Catenuloplanes sp.]|jgi:cyclopropane fatty-acyl-phospholipid synthase-like methyltransferase
MRADAVPERIRWAVRTLAVAPTDRLLEIGCGGGVAVALICPLLTTGTIVAIDRSATMTARARQRNAAHLHTGRASIRTAEFATTGPACDAGPFDKIFAVNVNLFWTAPARTELALARDLLAPGGTLHLYYQPPGERVAELTERLTDALTGSGFTTRATRSGSTLGVVARPAT